MTRKKGYLWLAAVLCVTLLIVVFVALRPNNNMPPNATVSALAVDSLQSMLLVTDKSSATRHPVSMPDERRARSAHYSQNSKNQTPAQPQPASPPEQIYRKNKRITVELNSADSLDLIQLYNLGPSFATRILKYRNLLGGFVCKEQLWEVYGMDSARYNDIAPYIAVNPSSITTLDINSATIEQLKRHPYLDYYQAKAIVRLREQAGKYRSLDDLRRVPIIDNETFTKIIPYLTCNSQQNK